MSIRNLDKIFAPTRVAVIGQATCPTSVGYTVFRNLVGSGFKGVVYPVNPRRESVQGIQAYKNVRSLPNVPDLAVICTPSPTIPEIVRSLGEAGTRGIVIISAGFREVGEAGGKLEDQVRSEQAKFPGCASSAPTAWGSLFPASILERQFRRRDAASRTHRLHFPIRGVDARRCSTGLSARALASPTSYPWAT